MIGVSNSPLSPAIARYRSGWYANTAGRFGAIQGDVSCSVDLRSTAAVGDRRYNHDAQPFMSLCIVPQKKQREPLLHIAY
jgi:hypothetical protein